MPIINAAPGERPSPTPDQNGLSTSSKKRLRIAIGTQEGRAWNMENLGKLPNQADLRQRFRGLYFLQRDDIRARQLRQNLQRKTALLPQSAKIPGDCRLDLPWILHGLA